MTTTDRFIDVPSGQIFARRWEPDSSAGAEPLILLHDSLGSVELWRDFPEVLASAVRRTVIAYDRLGFGRSSDRVELPSRNFIGEEAEIYLPCLLADFEIDTFSLFGYSVGGGMALTIASQLPQCHKVISESAQAFVEPRTIEGILAAKARFSDPAQVERLAKWHGDKADWVLRAWIDVWLSPPFAEWSLADVLPGVQCPVLAIHGDRDEFGSTRFPETICELTSGPCQVEILKGCGHMPHRERLDEVLALTQTFLNG